MTVTKPTLRTCRYGHKYYKSSDCPTCPICEEERKPKDNFLSHIAAPARRALEREGISSLEKLSAYSEKEIFSYMEWEKAPYQNYKNYLKRKGYHLSRTSNNHER